MKEINASDFQQEVLESGKVVLDFYSTECPPCEALAPKFEALNELYGEKIKFLKIFRQGNRELATRLGVSSSPTLLFFDNGKQIDTSNMKLAQDMGNLVIQENGVAKYFIPNLDKLTFLKFYPLYILAL